MLRFVLLTGGTAVAESENAPLRRGMANKSEEVACFMI